MKGEKSIIKFILLLVSCFMMVGCNKMESKDIIDGFKKNIDTSHYILNGKMDIVSNEELYHYDVNVSFLEGDYYKASLINSDTDYEQIILKNESGVYVKT